MWGPIRTLLRLRAFLRLVFLLVMRRCLAVGALIVMASACSSGSSSPDNTSDTPTPPSTLYAPAEGGTLKWKSCSGDSLDPLQCARLSVPFDYNNPSKGSFSLKLVKHPANFRTQRVGSMLVNPGGPGFGELIFLKMPTRISAPH